LFCKLDEAFWDYKITLKTSIRLTPFQLVYRKACDLLLELEHKALWDLKTLNFDLKPVEERRKL